MQERLCLLGLSVPPSINDPCHQQFHLLHRLWLRFDFVRYRAAGLIIAIWFRAVHEPLNLNFAYVVSQLLP